MGDLRGRARWGAGLVQQFKLYGTLGMRLGKASVRRRILTDLGLMLLISVVLACFCVTKNGGMELYMSTFLPMQGVLLLLFALCEVFRSSRGFCFCAAMLILTGVTLQVLLLLPAAEGEQVTAGSLVANHVISILFAVGMVPVLRFLVGGVRRKGLVLFLNIAMIALYLALLVWGSTYNSTRAWIRIGGFAFQMTEVLKVMALVTLGLIFDDPDRTADNSLCMGLLTLTINGVFLLAVNELGTLCVLGVVYVLMALVYQPNVRHLLVILAVLLLAASLVLTVCYGCQLLEQQSVAAEAAEPAEESGVVALGAKIYRKFKLRMDLVLDPDSVDANDGGYQTNKAREALVLSNWLGSAAEVYIPVVRSDYIFCYLLLKMGVCFGIAVLLMLLYMLLHGAERCLKNDTPGEGAVGLAFILAIFVQALIAAASSTGYFITVGLPFAFLADGGSAMLTNYVMVVYLLYVIRRIRLEPVAVPRVMVFKRKENVYGLRPF